MPARLTPVRVATPALLVTAEPTETAFRAKLTDLPLAGSPPAVRVAETDVVPPNTPLAADGTNVLAASENANTVPASAGPPPCRVVPYSLPLLAWATLA